MGRLRRRPRPHDDHTKNREDAPENCLQWTRTAGLAGSFHSSGFPMPGLEFGSDFFAFPGARSSLAIGGAFRIITTDGAICGCMSFHSIGLLRTIIEELIVAAGQRQVQNAEDLA